MHPISFFLLLVVIGYVWTMIARYRKGRRKASLNEILLASVLKRTL